MKTSALNSNFTSELCVTSWEPSGELLSFPGGRRELPPSTDICKKYEENENIMKLFWS